MFDNAALPSEFDADYYRALYADLAHFDAHEAAEHFLRYGRDEGRRPCAAAVRESFLGLVPREGAALEIGPFGNPQLRGHHVRYADMLSTAELRARALAHGYDPQQCPTIHYVLSRMPLERIEERFKSVFSSHCIEHQPDLAAHLQAVGRLLAPGDAYYLIVPDKRYCFDHFLPEATTAGVLAAHAEKRRRHSLVSWLGAAGLTTHNDALLHWQGEHGRPLCDQHGPRVFLDATKRYEEAERTGEYLDCHAWQFTPASFGTVCSHLFQLGLSPLRPEVVCETIQGRIEFCAILRKQSLPD